MRLSDTLDLLTNMQRKVFLGLLSGEKAPEIAKRLGTSLRCVYNHQASIYRKLEVRNSYDLISRYSIKEMAITDLIDQVDELKAKIIEIEKRLPTVLPAGKL